MKNDIIRFENNVPDNYLVGSRDYQALLRLFTFGISSVKFDVDNIRYVNDASHINSRLLNLLKLKVGFFTKEEFKDQYIREVLKVFSLIVKKKGTRQAIYDAINLYFRACRYNGDYVVEINNKDSIQPYMIRIGVTKESNDILLLEEILKYILPTGYLYEVFKYSTAKYRSNYYSQDIVTLSVVDDYNGSNIHNNISNVFIKKLYEGVSIGPSAIASFYDGADDAPLKSCVVSIEPQQDLNGYDYPWPAGGGKNLLDPAIISQGTIDNPSSPTNVHTEFVSVKPNTAYTISLTTQERITAIYVRQYRADQTSDTVSQAYNNYKLTLTTDGDTAYIKVLFYRNGGVTTQQIIDANPQIEEGSTATAYAPYSNICPITGWTQCDGVAAGNGLVEMNDLSVPTGANNTVYVSQVVFLKKGTYTLSWTLSKTVTATRLRPMYYSYADSDYHFADADYKTAGRSSWTFTLSEDQRIQIGVWYHTVSEACSETDFQLELDSTATAYAAPTLTPITIPLGQTVYGGTLDVLAGNDTSTRNVITLDGSQSINASSNNRFYVNVNDAKQVNTGNQSSYCGVMSDRMKSLSWANLIYNSQVGTDACCGPVYGKGIAFRWDRFTSAAEWTAYFTANPTQFCYEYDSPVPFTTTPQQMSSQLGTNNIWADAGSISLEYLSEADGGNYINYYNVYNNVTDNYINILTYPSVDNIELYNGDFTVSISEADFDLDNANMYVLIHQYLKDDRIVCSETTWSMSYDAQTDSITATSGNNEINISYSNFIRNLPLLEDHEIPSSFTLEYENESVSTEGFVLQDDNRSFTFTGYSGNKIIVKYKTDSQYLGKRIDNVVVYKNGWENESN